MGKQHLEDAKARKDDEFFSLRADLEKEIGNFADRFRGKAVVCPCNDGPGSAFCEFFRDNFEVLGLRDLVCVEYPTGRVYRGRQEQEELKGNGDCLGDEVQNLIQDADIICTNPPFSLLRPFIVSLLEKKKDFLVMAPELSITAREIGPYYVRGELEMGYTRPTTFGKPDGSTASLNNVIWLTTFSVEKPPLTLAAGDISEFKCYDNFGAREIPAYKKIPENLGGELIGVPITFAKYLDRRQFEVVGVSEVGDVPVLYVEGAKKFRRLILRRKWNGVERTN